MHFKLRNGLCSLLLLSILLCNLTTPNRNSDSDKDYFSSLSEELQLNTEISGTFSRISTWFLTWRVRMQRTYYSSKFNLSFPLTREGKHGLTCLALNSKPFTVDITVYMDIELNPGPEFSILQSTKSTPNCYSNSGKQHIPVRITNRAIYYGNKSVDHYAPSDCINTNFTDSCISPSYTATNKKHHHLNRANLKYIKSNQMPTTNLRSATNRNHLKIAHLNIQSLKNRQHYLQLKDLAFNNDFDLITLSETWLNSSVTNVSVQLNGYTLHRLDRKLRGKALNGVCAYVRSYLKVKVLRELSEISDSGLHQLWLQIQSKKLVSIIVCVAYRPPSECPVSSLHTDLSPRVIQALSFNKDVVITGDLNCDLLKDNTNSRALKDFCNIFNFKQVISSPTRISKDTETLIDIIIVSNPNLVLDSNVLDITISDHYLVYTKLNLKRPKPEKKQIIYRNFKNYNSKTFSADLMLVPWHIIESLEDIDDKTQTFQTLFSNVLDEHAPIKTATVKPKPIPFMTEDIKQLMKERDSLLKHYRNTHSLHEWEEYKNLRQQVKHQIKMAETAHYQSQMIKNSQNSSSMWKTIRQCLPNKDLQGFTYSKDNFTVSNDFNNYFISVGSKAIEATHKLAEKHKVKTNNPCEIHPPVFEISDQFFFKAVNTDAVKKIIMSLANNKSPGFDKIPVFVIKDCLPQIINPITHIINSSLLNQTFPNLWKRAEVIPIHKEGDQEVPANYRPISLLSVLSKICEKIVHNQFSEYLTKNNRLTVCQSGNRKQCSTETILVETTDNIINSMDKKQLTAMVLLDLSKAFDTINHDILIHKLRILGCSQEAINWFKDYLTSRTQYVRIGTSLSNSETITSGVPQGSILGPLLFNLYLNDLPGIVRTSNLHSYVDDTRIYLSFPISEIELAKSTLENDLNTAAEWFMSHQLKINPTKTKLLVFGVRQLLAHAPNLELNFLGETIKPSISAKDLGVILDSNLSYNDHIDKLSSSCFSALSQINRVKHIFNIKTLLTIINTLVFSKLFYCSSVWSNTSQTNVNKLQLVQNYAARVVSGTRKYDHITPVLNDLKWLSVKDKLFYRDAILTYKCITGLAPTYLKTKFLEANIPRKYNTRNAENLYIPRCRTNTGKRSFFQRGCKLWNDLDNSIKNATSLAEFKHKLIHNLKENKI